MIWGFYLFLFLSFFFLVRLFHLWKLMFSVLRTFPWSNYVTMSIVLLVNSKPLGYHLCTTSSDIIFLLNLCLYLFLAVPLSQIYFQPYCQVCHFWERTSFSKNSVLFSVAPLCTGLLTCIRLHLLSLTSLGMTSVGSSCPASVPRIHSS